MLHLHACRLQQIPLHVRPYHPFPPLLGALVYRYVHKLQLFYADSTSCEPAPRQPTAGLHKATLTHTRLRRGQRLNRAARLHVAGRFLQDCPPRPIRSGINVQIPPLSLLLAFASFCVCFPSQDPCPRRSPYRPELRVSTMGSAASTAVHLVQRKKKTNALLLQYADAK